MTRRSLAHGRHECAGLLTLGLTCNERYKGTNIQECLGTAFKRSVRWNVCGAHFQNLSLRAVFTNRSLMQQDYYSVLASVIMASARDDAQLGG